MNKQESEKVISPYSHPINRVLNSRKPALVLIKYILVIIVAMTGFFNLYIVVTSLIPPSVYKKDFIQEYLLARAVLDGIDPYLPLPELSQQFLGSLPNLVFQHPTPHPPPVALLCIPLTLFSYEQAAVVWFLLEMIFIVLAVYLILRWLDARSRLILTIITTLLILVWSPFRDELVIGQLMALLLVLLIGAWQALRSGKDIKGGVFLGCLISLKLMAWPIVIFLAIRKNWRAVVAAGTVSLAANLGAALVMGFERVIYFYLKVGTIVSSLYRSHEANFSMWTIGWRMFEGTGSPVLLGIEAPPLVSAPAIAPYFSFVILLALVCIGLKLALQADTFDISFGILVCVSILVNPVAWSHYLILTLIPLVIIGHRIYSLGLPKKETWNFLMISLLLFIPRLVLRQFILLLTGNDLTAKSAQVPFVATLPALIPTVAILCLLWLLSHIEHVYLEKAS